MSDGTEPDAVSDEILKVAHALNGDVAELRAQLHVLSAGHDRRDVTAKVSKSNKVPDVEVRGVLHEKKYDGPPISLDDEGNLPGAVALLREWHAAHPYVRMCLNYDYKNPATTWAPIRPLDANELKAAFKRVVHEDRVARASRCNAAYEAKRAREIEAARAPPKKPRVAKSLPETTHERELVDGGVVTVVTSTDTLVVTIAQQEPITLRVGDELWRDGGGYDSRGITKYISGYLGSVGKNSIVASPDTRSYGMATSYRCDRGTYTVARFLERYLRNRPSSRWCPGNYLLESNNSKLPKRVATTDPAVVDALGRALDDPTQAKSALTTLEHSVTAQSASSEALFGAIGRLLPEADEPTAARLEAVVRTLEAPTEARAAASMAGAMAGAAGEA